MVLRRHRRGEAVQGMDHRRGGADLEVHDRLDRRRCEVVRDATWLAREAPVKKCRVCHERPAELPDRYKMGRPIKRICRRCHRDRILADIKRIGDLLRPRSSTEEQRASTSQVEGSNPSGGTK